MALLGWLVALAYKKISRKDVIALAPAFAVGMLIFFKYDKFLLFFDFVRGFIVKPEILWVVCALGIVFLTYKLSNKRQYAHAFVKFFIIISFFYQSGVIVNDIFEEQNSNVVVKKRAINKANLDFKFVQKPNIYYILVDRYMRQDTLLELFKYDNSEFLKNLEELGFSVSRTAFSNYHFTLPSVAATMNMEYHKHDSVEKSALNSLNKGDNNVNKVLIKNGYKIIHMPSVWGDLACVDNADKCIYQCEKANVEIYRSFLDITPLKHFGFCYIEPKAILDTKSDFEGKPKFVFLHLAQVHDFICNGPVIDSFCGYISSVKMMNDKLKQTVTDLLKYDKNCIIVIQADHGVGNPSGDPFNATFNLSGFGKNIHRHWYGILSAVYVSPGIIGKDKLDQYFSGKFSLVNVFRMLFSTLSGKKAELLPDKSLLMYGPKGAQVIDISYFNKWGKK